MKRGNNEKNKSLLQELSNQNELLNKNNNELNIKVLSMARLIKIKDNQINIINNLIIKKALKNIFLKKYIKENKLLLNAFINLKYYKKKKYLQSKLYYDHEIFFYILKTNKNNLSEKGIGDYNINLKLYIRRQICLTLFKKRKYYTQNQLDISFKNFENILYIKDENNLFIEGIKKCNNFKIEKNINYNIINNYKKNKKQNFDFSVSHLKIISNMKKNIFDNKKLINKSYINFSILSDRNINIDYKKENEKLKNELIQKETNIKEMKNNSINNDSQIEILNKKILKLQEEINLLKYENSLYKELNNKSKNNKNNKIVFSLTKINFNIISNKNKIKDITIYKKTNSNFSIISKINKIKNKAIYKKSKLNLEIISNYYKKGKNNIFNNLSKSNIIN